MYDVFGKYVYPNTLIIVLKLINYKITIYYWIKI